MTLPFPDKAMTFSGLIVGTRGAGKSTTARDLFEHELDQGHRCGFIDPMGDAAGIRLNPDGSPSRFSTGDNKVVIFGGPNADIPITDQDGEKVAHLVGKAKISFLIDLSGMIEAEQHRFVTGFADVLYDVILVPMLLLIDEAHIFAPQQVRDAPSKLLNRITRLNTQGRKRGIFLWLMTQRPARINKNVISGAESLIAMRVTMPRDIAVISEWLEMHDGANAGVAKGQLASLKTGQAFVSIPLLEFFERVQFVMPTTMDTGRTPQHGETVGGIELPKIDLGDLAKTFGQMETGDPRDDEIALLREQLRDTGVRARAAADEVLRVTQERDALIETITAVQDRLGMFAGSPRIYAAPADVHPDDLMMVQDVNGGDVRPVWKDGVAVDRIRGGRLRMRAAQQPGGKKGNVK
jgi:uncharacterized protein